jgi:pimeloyl-ACP methyl ester carboxylesterase
MEAMLAPAVTPEITQSRTLPGKLETESWLRFRSPSARVGDDVYARVHEPRGVADPPTVIFGHGICVEFDHWRGLVDETQTLVAAGCRVIRPEAPWHGRRVPPGYYGGERIIATFPMGILDAMTSAVSEWAVLAHWARRTSRGPLGFAGSSLGALTSQLAASAAHDWPEPLRPDALLLITHSGDLGEVVLKGTLADMWSNADAAKRLGWTEPLARELLGHLEPTRAPVVPGRRIVSVLGRNDKVLPFVSGKHLVEQWCLPEENVFIWNRGHFSVPMTLIHNKQPVERFVAVLRGLG